LQRLSPGTEGLCDVSVEPVLTRVRSDFDQAVRVNTVSPPLHRGWWWVFGLLIAAPALALALLSLRAIRADRIEREQRLRDQQGQVARLADAAISNLLDGIVTALGGVADDQPPDRAHISPELHDLPVFLLDRSGVLAFPQHRVYFGQFGRRPRSLIDLRDLPPEVSELADRAQVAEVQRRTSLAMSLYRRASAQPTLKAWAELGLARIKYQRGDPSATALLVDSAWGASEARTPTGVPVAIVASSYVEQSSSKDRARFAPLLNQTLESLRAGLWWLSYDQRRIYDSELRRWLNSAGITADLRDDEGLEELAGMERVVRRSLPDLRDTMPRARFERADRAGVLIVWSPPESSSDTWVGTTVSERRLQDLVDIALRPLFAGQPFAAALRDPEGIRIWGAIGDTEAIWREEELGAVPGWHVAFTGPDDVAARGQGRLLWYGLVLLPIIVLASGLAMTVRIIRRELALARVQSELLAGVSHEFKSPITGIRLLMERIVGGRLRSEEGAQYYAAIGRETDRLESLVNRLLESQKIQTGRKQYTFAVGSLVEIVESAVGRMRPHAEAKSIELEAGAEPGLPDLALDRGAIAQAVENLLDNAIKYSATGTRVSLRVRAVDNEVHVEVCDQGIGIDQADLRGIFDPFYRGRRGDLENVHGSGLGLALVKAAVEAHNGTVEVTSTPGRGSQFTVRLPITRPDGHPTT
jgi:signal transduction histidine kinase